MRICLFLACMATTVLAGPLSAQVVINEFSYDDTGTDDREFLELFNAGTTTVDISGWVVQNIDGAWTASCPFPPTTSTPCDNNADFTIPPGTLLGPGAFWVIGMAAVPNVNQVTTLTLENDVESIILHDSTGAVQDVVRYESNKIGSTGFLTYPPGFDEAGGIWGNFTSKDTAPQSWSRWFDGRDTNNNGSDFGLLPSTPGASNNIATALSYFNDFNAGTPGNAETVFRGSFLDPTIIDPTVVGPLVAPANTNINPNAIPASPDGGNCMIVWDNAGGGDTAMFTAVPSSDFTFEAYVYIDGTPRPANEQEQWSIGVRGTSDTFGNFFFPGGMNASNACGDTGIAWHYTIDQLGGTLSLLDENNGGDDETILATIAIVPGTNDGWQRIRLQVVGNQIDAIFGGTYGSILDGARTLATTTTSGVGAVYFAYREFITTNANTRPLTLDFVTIRVPYLTKDVDTVNAPAGGTVNFGLHAGAGQGLLVYAVLLSATAGDPGPFIGAPHNTLLPVIPDFLTTFALLNANTSPIFANFVSALDLAGEGTASSTIPPIMGLPGAVPIYVGYVTLANPAQLNGFGSNQVTFTIVP
jgi:hypothetical protein